MWAATVLGFFSIVKKGGPGEWQIRARVRRDLENLCKAIKIPASRIITTQHSDYAYRIVVKADELTKVFEALQAEINYTNFKNEIHRRPDQSNKNGPYMSIWSTMMRIQPSRVHGSRKGQGYLDFYTSGHSHHHPLDDIEPPPHAYTDERADEESEAGLFREWSDSGSPLSFQTWMDNREAKRKANRLLGKASSHRKHGAADTSAIIGRKSEAPAKVSDDPVADAVCEELEKLVKIPIVPNMTVGVLSKDSLVKNCAGVAIALEKKFKCQIPMSFDRMVEHPPFKVEDAIKIVRESYTKTHPESAPKPGIQQMSISEAVRALEAEEGKKNAPEANVGAKRANGQRLIQPNKANEKSRSRMADLWLTYKNDANGAGAGLRFQEWLRARKESAAK